KARLKEQAGKAREDAQVSAVIATANEEIDVGQAPVRRPERNTGTGAAIGNHGVAQDGRHGAARVRNGDTAWLTGAGDLFTLLHRFEERGWIVDNPGLLRELD